MRKAMIAATLAALTGLALFVPLGHSDSAGVERKGDGPHVLVQGRAFGALASLTFRLDYLAEADCFVADSGPSEPGARDLNPIVWPPGTKVIRNGDKIGIAVPDSSSIWGRWRADKFWVGHNLRGTGGALRQGQPLSIPEVPAACHGAGKMRLFYVLNSIESAD